MYYVLAMYWVQPGRPGDAWKLEGVGGGGRGECVHFPTPGGEEEEGGGRGSQTPADPKGSADIRSNTYTRLNR